MPLAVAVVAAAAAGALVVRAAPFAGVVVLAVIVFAYLAQMARRPLGEVLLVAMIGLAGIVDILQKIDAGAASGQAVETVAMVWLGFLVCLSGLSIPEGAAGRALGLLALFVAFTVVSYSWGTISTQSIQNVLVYIACLLFTAIAATVVRYRPRQLYEVLSKAWWVAGSIGLGLYAVSVAIAGPGTHQIISPRPLGLLGVLLVAWFVAGARVGRKYANWMVGAALLLTLLSLSRSALAAQVAMVALARFDLRTFRSWLVAIGAIVAALSVAIATVFLYAPLHHRFFHGDTAQVGGISINVTGRDTLWAANWDYFVKAPVIGHGAGAADRLTSALPEHGGAAHPHNDYLRILVDYGIVGLVLWFFAYFALLRLTWRRWGAVRGSRTIAEHIHGAAALVLIGIGLTMIVDNPLIELARMAPLGVMLGMSLGLPSAREAQASERLPALVAAPVGAGSPPAA
jgi:O-antigen ligase